MKMRSMFVALAVVLLSSNAFAIDTNTGQWSGVFLQGNFSKHWGWAVDHQVRLQNGSPAGEPFNPQFSRGNRFLANAGVRYMPFDDPSLQFQVAYGFTPTWSPSRNENRLWEQAQWSHEFDPMQFAVRLRVEQRWIENAAGMAVRTRGMVRLVPWFLDKHKLGLAIWDEVFWNINSVTRGPAAGFEQNWAFIGANFPLSDSTRIEAGYLNAYGAKGNSPSAIMDHVGMVMVLSNL